MTHPTVILTTILPRIAEDNGWQGEQCCASLFHPTVVGRAGCCTKGGGWGNKAIDAEGPSGPVSQVERVVAQREGVGATKQSMPRDRVAPYHRSTVIAVWGGGGDHHSTTTATVYEPKIETMDILDSPNGTTVEDPQPPAGGGGGGGMAGRVE